MTARFKMDQPGGMPPVVGVYGKATQDIQAGINVDFVAEDATHSTYDWEVLTQPQESMLPGPPVVITPVPGTPWLGSATFGHTGGHLIRLTVDVGMITEDVQVLYMGIRLPVSGLALPALEETIFDNSVDDPAYRGWESKIDAYLKWVDSVIGGGVVTPTGWGRIYVDQLNGSDVTGTGSHEKPYQSLDHATGTITPTVDPAEFLTPYEFVIAPGYYSSMGGVIRMPFRRKVTFSGRDVVIADQIRWDINPGAWADVGLAPTDYLPEFFINGEGTGWQARPYSSTLVPESYGPSFRVEGGINIVNAFPGIAPWVGGQKLHLDMVSISSVVNSQSAGPTPLDATGKLYLYTDRCWFGGIGVSPDYNAIVGSVAETAVPDELNLIYISARETNFNLGIFSYCVFLRADECTFSTINKSFDGDLLSIAPGGYIGCRDPSNDLGPVFRDCEFEEVAGSAYYGYRFGWDGATGSEGEPYGPTFDQVSYRSLLDTDAISPAFVVENVAATQDVAVREGAAQVYAVNDVAMDLVNDPGGPYIPGNEYMVPRWNMAYMDTDFALDRMFPSRIYVTRDGRFVADILVQIANEQILFDAVVVAAAYVNGALIPNSMTYVTAVPGFPGAGTNAQAESELYNANLSAGDYVEIFLWIHGFFGGIFPISVGVPGIALHISRYE